MEPKRYKKRRSIVTKVSVTVGLLILICSGGIHYYYIVRNAGLYRHETELYARQIALLAATTISEDMAIEDADGVARKMAAFVGRFQDIARIEVKSKDGKSLFVFENKQEKRQTVSASAAVVMAMVNEKLGTVSVTYPYGDFLSDTRERRFESITEMAAELILSDMKQDNLGPAANKLKEFFKEKQNILFVALLYENCSVILSDPPARELKTKYGIKKIEEVATTPDTPFRRSDGSAGDFRYTQHEKLLFDPDGEYGVLKIGYSTGEFLREKKKLSLQLVIIIIVFVAVAVGLAISFSFRLTRPILYLARIARKIGEGFLDEPASVKTGGDELEALGDAMNEMVKGLKERNLVKDTFSRYVTSQVAEELLKNPEALSLGGKKQFVTVLFSDIRGFTNFSENFAPEEVVEHLNEYLSAMVDIVFKHEGTLDKFIGDAIMVVFGAPKPHADDAIRAVRTALEMREKLAELNAKWQQQHKKSFEIGIGINSGEVIAGNIGDIRRMEYTVIGDNVNLASRIESLTKDTGAPIIISRSTYQLVKDQVDARELQSMNVKGKSEPVQIYELIGLKG